MKPFRVLTGAYYRPHARELSGWVGGREVSITEIVCVVKEADDVFIIETADEYLLLNPPAPMDLEGIKRSE